MNIIQASLLGIVQGLTEFLPVSSSGHLVLIQKLLPGFSQPGITFDVLLHFGTLFSVLFYFKSKIFKLSMKYWLFIVIGSIPAFLAGFFFMDVFEEMFKVGAFLWLEFMVSGIFNLLVDYPVKRNKPLGITNSFVVGISQAIAIIPAISRSGATIFTGVRLGIKKEDIAQFSFLLSIPAVLGANVLELVSYRSEINNLFSINYFIGFVTALIVGLISIKIVYKFLEMNKFRYFGYYCIILGFISLILR